MKRAPRHRQGKSAFELLEETVHLLRAGSGQALASYYLGTLPFVLGLLYFWTDMSRSPFAGQHLAEASLGIAVLFLWMKTWQAIFARQFLAHLTGVSAPLSWRRFAHIVFTQAAVQPTALLVLPLASIPVLPLAWVYAFYQNVTALAADDSGSPRAAVRNAIRQAGFWPRQNHALLSVLFAFGLFVFLNWATVVLLLPGMFKALLGLESVFSRNILTMLNTTFFAVVTGLAYLCVDPIIKAAFALRCFYGESLSSGTDLKAELRHFAPAPQALAAVFLLALSCCAQARPDPPVAESAPPGTAPPLVESALEQHGRAETSISPTELDRTIGEVLQERKYAWRAPRERAAENSAAQKGIVGRFLERVGKVLKKWVTSFGNWLDRLLRKLFQGRRLAGPASSGFGWMTLLHLLIYLALAAAVVAILLLIRRAIRNRNAQRVSVAAQPLQPAPDLADENLAADQLPEDGWTKLAEELLGRGELRLALRALYLASLAHLATRNLITLARFKSNRDYERELLRRGHSWPDLLRLFGDNVSIFDRIWYGMHPVDGGLVSQFAANVEKIRGGA